MSASQTIYLIGGTTEANQAVSRLQSEGHKIVVSVATRLGERVAAQTGVETDTGRKNASEMAGRARAVDAVAIVDCSHPFAREVSNQAARAADLAELPYFRYTRPPVTATGENVVTVPSFDSAADLLHDQQSRALLTIGTRNLGCFIQRDIEFTARILPSMESLEDCACLGIEPKDIIAAWPPFSSDFNRACLRRSRAAALVTKESGREGGLREKIYAATAENASLIIISRPSEPAAMHDLDLLVSRLARELKS